MSKYKERGYAYPEAVGFKTWIIERDKMYYRDLNDKIWGPYKNPNWVPPKDFNPSRRFN